MHKECNMPFLRTKCIDYLKLLMKKNYILWKIFTLYYILHNKCTLLRFKANIPIAAQGEPTVKNPTSQLATAAQCFETDYITWCDTMRSPARMNRKQWEFVYILQVLRQQGCLANSKRGLGFGCGQEPIPAILANHGCYVVASDVDFEQAKHEGWVHTQQHAATLDALNPFQLCDPTQFKERVCFEIVNMNSIPSHLQDFDFLWSSCALEHLGSIEHGLHFIKNAMHCLKPGGIAVHTTEYNLSSDTDTIDAQTLCLFRKQDILRLEKELQDLGHHVFAFNFNAGNSPMDKHIDLPPYKASPHIKLQLSNYSITSIGIIVQKGLTS